MNPMDMDFHCYTCTYTEKAEKARMGVHPGATRVRRGARGNRMRSHKEHIDAQSRGPGGIE